MIHLFRSHPKTSLFVILNPEGVKNPDGLRSFALRAQDDTKVFGRSSRQIRIIKFWLAACLLLAGCETMPGPSPELLNQSRMTEEAKMSAMSRRFISLGQIYNGMTRNEVQSILGKQIIVGYELNDPNDDKYKPMILNNPYRSEIYRNGAKYYEVDYYLVGINQPDGKVTDDELVPLVFLDGKLIGTGWMFFNQEIKPSGT